MTTEEIEKRFSMYEDEIKTLDNENRKLKIKIKNYENIVFALKSILEIAD